MEQIASTVPAMPTAPTAQPQVGEISQFDEKNLTDTSKSQLEDYVLAGYEIIYDEGNDLIHVANRADSITRVDDVSNALLLTALKIDRSREQNRLPPFPDQIKIIGAYHLNDKVIEFAEHQGAKPFTPEEKKMSLQGAIQKYMERGIKAGTIDPKELAIAAEKVRPGSVSQSLAAMPDDPNTGSVETANPVTPAAPPQGAQEKKPGLLGDTPSPLARFLK